MCFIVIRDSKSTYRCAQQWFRLELFFNAIQILITVLQCYSNTNHCSSMLIKQYSLFSIVIHSLQYSTTPHALNNTNFTVPQCNSNINHCSSMLIKQHSLLSIIISSLQDSTTLPSMIQQARFPPEAKPAGTCNYNEKK